MEHVNQLEKEYANFVGSDFAVAVNSGTSALHLSLVSIGVGHGDEVIVPDFTMSAIGFAVSYTGATPVVVDCDHNLNIDVNRIQKAITPRTKAIIAVHTYGKLCDMEAINHIAKRFGLYVIEDGCEAQGAARMTGSDFLIFSFYKNKIIHAEEGGIICTNNEEHANNIRDLKNMAFGKKHDYFHTRIGYNYRMPDSQAKMALESLHKYPENTEKRRKFEEAWNQILPTAKRDAVWVYDVICNGHIEKEKMIEELNAKGIPWRHFFKPLSTMPMWKQRSGRNALDYSNRGLYICYNEN